jgi:hypothetical protein
MFTDWMLKYAHARRLGVGTPNGSVLIRCLLHRLRSLTVAPHKVNDASRRLSRRSPAIATLMYVVLYVCKCVYVLVVSGRRSFSRSAFRVALRAIASFDDGSGKGWAASIARFELLLLVFSLLYTCSLSCDPLCCGWHLVCFLYAIFTSQ